MVNIYKLRKWGGLLICCFIPTITYTVGTTFYGMLYGMGFFGGGVLIAMLLANFMLKTPFNDMLEGAGLLVLNIDSTGIIRPFIAQLTQPYLKGKLGREAISDVYDRDSVIQMARPIKAGKAEYNGENIKIEITEDEFNRSRFNLFQYVTLIYNAQLNSFMTKDIISNQEKDSFAEHGILYLNRKMEELTSIIRDFGRYVVELTKPKSSIFQSKIFIVILIVGLLLLLVIFAKPIIDTFMGGSGSAAAAIGNVLPQQPVTPAGG